MIIVNTSNEELLKSVKDDMDRLQKEAEDALEENKDEAEDIAEDHGEDTKTVKEVVTDKTDRKQLKSMHLSESLFEDLDDSVYFDVINICDAFYEESLTEDLSPKGKKLVAELKQELGPELQRKVVALMKDLQSSITTTANKAVSKVKEESGKKQTNESLNESMWSVYYVDDDPQEGTLFAEEEDARKFQLEMGDDWEVMQLPNTPWDDLADTDLL